MIVQYILELKKIRYFFIIKKFIQEKKNNHQFMI